MKKCIFIYAAMLSLFQFSAVSVEPTDQTRLDSEDLQNQLNAFNAKHHHESSCDSPHHHHGKKKKPPNILFIMVDEERFPVTYESEELKQWKKENLIFRDLIASQGTVFHNHYVNTNACCPSRATIQTGQFPNVHGVTQTEGLAKEPTSPDMFWLQPFTVPTTGNYMREANYKTVYKGKWHITDSSIRLGDGSYLTTYNAEGEPIPELYAFYLEKNVLDIYGYDGWIGPEPIGNSPLNTGSSVKKPILGRDVKFAQQVLDELDVLEKEERPWLLVASFVNPHDIAAYGVYARIGALAGTDWSFPVDPTLPKRLFKPEFEKSFNESLINKPPAQMSYRDLFLTSIQPILNFKRFQKYYYSIQKLVDQDILQIWNKLVASPMYENTIVIFTSDHGELLGAHGKMIQKWYEAYQEAIHVPMIISSPLFGSKHKDVFNLTSHIDILPTFLDIAKADPEKLRLELGKKFSLNLPLPGKSLLTYVKHSPKKSAPVYFYTEDNPTKGPHQINLLCQPYDAVVEPSSVEAIITYIGNDLWKFTNYFSIYGNCDSTPGVKNEMYNVTKDPLELISLYNNPTYSKEQKILKNLLEDYRVKYRTVDPALT